MSWDSFATALAGVLGGLAERTYLIISDAAGRGYVQFAQNDEGLIAELPSDANLGGVVLGDAGNERVLAMGYERSGHGNFTRELPWPLSTEERRNLAGDQVVALRDLFGVTSPNALVYRAWRDPDILASGESVDDLDELDAGEDPLLLPELGIRPEPIRAA